MPEELKKSEMQSLEDRAWQDMRTRLDASMPVRTGLSGRERLLLLLLLLTIIFTGSYVVYNELYREDSHQKEIPGHELIPDGDFAAVIPGAEADVKAKAKAKVEGIPEVDESSEYLVGGQLVLTNERNNIAYPKANNYIGNMEHQSMVYIPYLTKKSIKIAGSPHLDIISDRVYLQQPGYTFVPVTFELERRINYLTRDHTFLSLNGNGGAAMVVQQLPVRCEPKYALSTGVISENLKSFGGVELGFDIYRPVRDKFALESGLFLQLFNKNGFSNSPALSTISDFDQNSPGSADDRTSWVEDRYQYEVQNSEIVNNQVGAEYITGIVDNLYYLTIPLNLQYRINNTRLMAGVNASLLLRGTNRIHDYNDQYFNTVVLSNSVLEKRNYFNRIDFGVQVGLETKIFKNLYLYGKYNYGLFQIINAESASLRNSTFKDNYRELYRQTPAQRVDFNRYFSLGVKYAFERFR